MANLTYKDIQKLIRLDKYTEIYDYPRIIRLGCDTEWNNIAKKYNGTGLDATDERAEDVSKLQMMLYRMDLMTIVCMYETWEQDLYNYLKEKNVITSRSNDFEKNKRDISQIVDNFDIKNYPVLDNIRHIVNTIKHGNGSSFNQIISLFGNDILADSNSGEINKDGTTTRTKQRKYDENTLTSETLNLKGKLDDLYKSIIDFWQDVFKTVEQKEQNQKI